MRTSRKPFGPAWFFTRRRKTAHPIRTVKYAVTPRPVRQLSRAIYTVTNPLGAAENALVNSLFAGRGKNRRRTATRAAAPRATPTTSTSDVRAAEGAAAHDQLAALMSVQRERFSPAQRPVINSPVPVDREALAVLFGHVGDVATRS
ncbi:hypothetical protein [Amycolatopsis sp. NPDC001319]|uniref:hypothetical protein n=1 Tax=unclassified Amycolatopsis TaxID=2618356 RepID=UPI0036A30390